MKNASGDDCGKKFQLTDSLLKRVLRKEDYDGIKTVEPVFVYTDEPNCKQLKGPGYKHAALSSNFLYIVNTPAKQDSDLIFSVPLEEVEDLKIVYDTADFLQGDLRKTSQHVQLSCKKHLSTTKHLLFKAASLALGSSDKLQNDNEETKMSFSRSSSNLYLDGNEDLQLTESLERNCKSLNTSPTSSHTHADLKLKLLQEAHGSIGKSSKKKTSRRPLPKPLAGTEMLNASYTSGTLIAGLKRGKKKKLIDHHNSSSFSIESLDIQNSLLQKKPLSQSQRNYLHSSSLNQSWNDILRTEQHSSTKNPIVQSPLLLSEKLVASLNKSGSSKLARSFSENKNKSTDETSKPPLTPRDSRHSEGSISTRYSKTSTVMNGTGESSSSSLDSYEVHVFTVAPGSKLFNLIEQSWIYCLLENTTKMRSTLFESTYSIPSQHRTQNTDEIMQKFTQLKEEIISSKSNDELFMLTKELKHASEKYLLVRKTIWKSTSLLHFYMTKLKLLLQSPCSNVNTRMDELDASILIGEFFVSIFQDSEMFSGRQMLLNENSAKFVKDLIDIVIATPTTKCIISKDPNNNDELLDLITSWSDVSIALLFEIINAAKQNVWCCTLGMKSLDVILLSRHLDTERSQLKKILEQLVFTLTSILTPHVVGSTARMTSSTSSDSALPPPLTPATLVTVFKSMMVLHFVCAHCPRILDHVKTFYHEEIKYYISKEENWERLPSNYPVISLIKSSLPEFFQIIT